MDFFVLLACSLIYVPILIGTVYLIQSSLALGLILTLGFAFFPVVLVYRVVNDVILLRRVKNGGFLIVKDAVSYVSPGEMPRSRSEGRRAVDVIYFARYGRFVSGGVTFAMASGGDEFYLVILHGRKDKIVFAYHTMMYECNECDS